jgi:hypothetical protein
MADAPARDLLAELFDQFDPDEQARIRAAEDAATEILLQGSAAVRDRLLAAGSPNLNDWSQEPENDAQADAATAVYVAYINGLWRQTDTGRPECIEEFLTKIESSVTRFWENTAVKAWAWLTIYFGSAEQTLTSCRGSRQQNRRGARSE